MECHKCNVVITPTNWSRHVRSQKHQRNDPNGAIQPRRRGRPTNNATRKDLFSQTKEFGLRVYTKWNKQQLVSALSKAKKLLFRKDDLQKLDKNQLRNIAKENNIKVALKKKKDEIIEATLKTQDSAFRDITTRELSFHDDIIEPTKGEREPAYSIIQKKSRFIQKFNATEVDYPKPNKSKQNY